MEHLEKIILLNFDRRYFEEIYFKNNQDSILLSPIVKRELTILIGILLLLGGSIIYSLLTDKSAWLIAILTIAAVFALIPYCYKALQIQKWRKRVSEFLNRNDKFKIHKLVLTENSLTLIQDDNEDIHKWSGFTHVEITENYLH